MISYVDLMGRPTPLVDPPLRAPSLMSKHSKSFEKGLRSQFWQAKVSYRTVYAHSRLDGYSRQHTCHDQKSNQRPPDWSLDYRRGTDRQHTHTHIKPSVPSATSFLRRGTQTHTVGTIPRLASSLVRLVLCPRVGCRARMHASWVFCCYKSAPSP